MEVRSGYKQTEVGQIPAEWEVLPVRDMGTVITGKALAANAPGKQRPYLRTKNVFDGRIAVDDVLTMPMTDEQFAQFQVQLGDVLLNEGQSLDLVGRCAMYSGEYVDPCAIQNQLLRFRAKPEVSAAYATHLFRRCQQSGVFARVALQTTSIAHLGGARFERLRLAWPTNRLEQDAIATALSDVDALLTSLDRLIAKKRDFKHAAMQQLLTGQTRLPGFQGEWQVKRLEELADIDPENLGAETAPNYSFNYISLEDVDGGVLRSFSEQIFGSAPSRARRILRCGDVLVSTVRPNLKSHLLFDRKERGWVCSTGFCVVRARPNLSHPGYLMAHFFGNVVSGQIESLLTGSNYPAINSADVRRLVFPTPSCAEQSAIAAILSDMDAELAALEARRDKTRALKQGMMQELLTGRTRLV